MEEENNVDPALLRFLLNPANYPGQVTRVRLIESHMSLVFLAGDRAYKMKKPIKLDQLDYRSLDRRRENCERELTLNRVLAPDIYLGLTTVAQSRQGELHWDGDGAVIEWLVVMRRLENMRLLDHAIAESTVTHQDIDNLIALLGPFYARPLPTPPPAAELVSRWSKQLERYVQSLCAPGLGLPDHEVGRVLQALSCFLSERADLLLDRIHSGWIRDCHGDLRPQHVYLGPPLRLIDRLEFDDRLRWCDPFEEIMDLGVECERMGAAWITPMLIDGLTAQLGGKPGEALLGFYAGMRACLRAGLAIDHIRRARNGRAEQWRARAIAGIDLALKYACPQS